MRALLLLACAVGGRPASRTFAPRHIASSARTPPPTAPPTFDDWAAKGVPPPAAGDLVDRICRAVNFACRQTVVGSVRRAVALRRAPEQPGERGFAGFLAKATSPPELPPVSRPTWLVIAASVPTLLGWYGFYKFSTEEELFWEELRTTGRATGCGGYGTLLPFVYAVLLGGAGQLAGVHGSETLVEAGSAWILAGQVNLYRRVNELCAERGEQPPLYAWWALLPPPIDLIVGLRQLHFLAKRNAAARGEDWEGDAVAERLFPFISAPRFTLREFARRPSIWFWFTDGVPDIDWAWLQEVAPEP
ncbi:hypothetical protein KFE25_009912 [Diacronema lutheri]|uniref:Uncharacterized protein n=2 Tax=Diacronema lutheri TaxID=2081491 RepID=A0A8J6C9G4_DIALT|nr:hypothetical protein KFE25_009912 [Diacronema lutheri]